MFPVAYMPISWQKPSQHLKSIVLKIRKPEQLTMDGIVGLVFTYTSNSGLPVILFQLH